MIQTSPLSYRYAPHIPLLFLIVDFQKLSSMVEDWISQANARQRRGRAGRVKPGTCFCLYTRHRFEKLMRNFQVLSAGKKMLWSCIAFLTFFLSHAIPNSKVPEMLRMPLVELCLQIKLLSLGYIKPFLSKVINAIFWIQMFKLINCLNWFYLFTSVPGFRTS